MSVFYYILGDPTNFDCPADECTCACRLQTCWVTAHTGNLQLLHMEETIVHVLLRALTAILEKLLCRVDASYVFSVQFDGVVDMLVAFLFEAFERLSLRAVIR